MEHQDVQQKMRHASVDVGGGVIQERCIPIPRRVGAKPVAMETQPTDVPMVMGVQQTGDKSMATCTQCLDDNLDTGALHASQ